MLLKLAELMYMLLKGLGLMNTLQVDEM